MNLAKTYEYPLRYRYLKEGETVKVIPDHVCRIVRVAKRCGSYMNGYCTALTGTPCLTGGIYIAVTSSDGSFNIAACYIGITDLKGNRYIE